MPYPVEPIVAMKLITVRKLTQKRNPRSGMIEPARLRVNGIVQPGKDEGLLRLPGNKLIPVNNGSRRGKPVEITAIGCVRTMVEPKGYCLPE